MPPDVCATARELSKAIDFDPVDKPSSRTKTLEAYAQLAERLVWVRRAGTLDETQLAHFLTSLKQKLKTQIAAVATSTPPSAPAARPSACPPLSAPTARPHTQATGRPTEPPNSPAVATQPGIGSETGLTTTADPNSRRRGQPTSPMLSPLPKALELHRRTDAALRLDALPAFGDAANGPMSSSEHPSDMSFAPQPQDPNLASRKCGSLLQETRGTRSSLLRKLTPIEPTPCRAGSGPGG